MTRRRPRQRQRLQQRRKFPHRHVYRPPNPFEPEPAVSTNARVAAPPKPVPREPVHVEPVAPPRVAAARPPIDPNLPPDHPLEPGSAAGRSRPMPAAERTPAAQAAATGSTTSGYPRSWRQTGLHRRRTPRRAGRRRGFAARPGDRRDRRQGSTATRPSDAASAQVDRGRGGRSHHCRGCAHRLAAVRGRRHRYIPGAAARVRESAAPGGCGGAGDCSHRAGRVDAGPEGDPASGSRREPCARQGAAGERTAGAGAVLFGAGNRHQAPAAITER